MLRCLVIWIIGKNGFEDVDGNSVELNSGVGRAEAGDLLEKIGLFRPLFPYSARYDLRVLYSVWSIKNIARYLSEYASCSTLWAVSSNLQVE